MSMNNQPSPAAALQLLRALLEKALERSGLTKDRLATRTKLSRVTIQKAFGKPDAGPPSLRTLKRIMDVLGVQGSERARLIRLRETAVSQHETGRIPSVPPNWSQEDTESLVSVLDEVLGLKKLGRVTLKSLGFPDGRLPTRNGGTCSRSRIFWEEVVGDLKSGYVEDGLSRFIYEIRNEFPYRRDLRELYEKSKRG
ncbi:helix-turn-helix domain-containing protein [Streptomyces sp. NPDC001604]|uniref:helix-turn-helix domain-containing protein n=1 Tax=Streptomyces sp. NPDC001604 TaxID=3364593 RepID=UPI0036CAC1CE